MLRLTKSKYLRTDQHSVFDVTYLMIKLPDSLLLLVTFDYQIMKKATTSSLVKYKISTEIGYNLGMQIC